MNPPIALGQPSGAPPLAPPDVDEPVGTDAPPDGAVVVGGWVGVVAGVVAVAVVGTVLVEVAGAACVLVSGGWAKVSPAGCEPPEPQPASAASAIGNAMSDRGDRGMRAL
jgi:hypothetical protein